MNLLTIAGMKESLEYVRDHSDVTYHKNGPRKGFIVTPPGATTEQAYSLFLVQKFVPKLIVQHLEGLTVLTLDGQELLDILSDSEYLNKIVVDLKTIGYTNPSDRQIFREVRRRMEITDFNPPIQANTHKELFRDFFHAAYEVSRTGISTTSVNADGGIQLTTATKVEVIEEREPEFVTGISTASTHASDIQSTKTKVEVIEERQPELDEPTLVIEVPEKVEVAETEEVEDNERVGGSLVSSGPKLNLQGNRNDKHRKGRN